MTKIVFRNITVQRVFENCFSCNNSKTICPIEWDILWYMLFMLLWNLFSLQNLIVICCHMLSVMYIVRCYTCALYAATCCHMLSHVIFCQVLSQGYKLAHIILSHVICCHKLSDVICCHMLYAVTCYIAVTCYTLSYPNQPHLII